MKFTVLPIQCPQFYKKTKRTKPFHIIRYTFDYPSNSKHQQGLNFFIKEGYQLAQQVNPKAANDATQKRNFNRIFNNCVAGLLAEHLWRRFLNHENKTVRMPKMDNASTQIDLKIIKNDKKIEVRSSFPRNGIPFALCHPTMEFDVLGFYANDYKSGEIQKDYYVRTLFHLKRGETILQKIKTSDFEVYLTGGATWAMMTDNQKNWIDKDLIPQDERNVTRLKSKSKYRVVPFSRALDSLEIYKLIKREV